MRIRTICRGALGVAALLWLGIALQAAALTKLTVIVKTQAGRPVERAEVIVRWKANPKHPRIGFSKNTQTQFDVQTDQEGQVEVPAIPQGNILVQVVAKGYQTFGKIFEIYDDEKTVEVTVNPPQQQYSAH
jgi:uncharacterized GH25 family protein